jgi:hypothetical protein
MMAFTSPSFQEAMQRWRDHPPTTNVESQNLAQTLSAQVALIMYSITASIPSANDRKRMEVDIFHRLSQICQLNSVMCHISIRDDPRRYLPVDYELELAVSRRQTANMARTLARARYRHEVTAIQLSEMRRRFSAAEHMLQEYQDLIALWSNRWTEEQQQLREERQQAQNRYARDFIPAPPENMDRWDTAEQK